MMRCCPVDGRWDGAAAKSVAKFPPNLSPQSSWRLSRQIFPPLSTDSDVSHRAHILNFNFKNELQRKQNEIINTDSAVATYGVCSRQKKIHT